MVLVLAAHASTPVDLGESVPELPQGQPSEAVAEDIAGIGASPSVLSVDVNVQATAAGSDAKPVALHRYYNKKTGDHFYTTNWGEIGAGKHGYVYEGIATYVFTDALQAKGLVPLYRWFNPFSGDHFYSTNLDSASTQNPKSPWTTVVRGGRLTGPGWRWEGIQAFVFKKQVPGTVPMYRLWNGRDHLYTTNYKESLKVVKFGYRSEGVEFFGVTQGVKPLPALPSPDFIPAKVVTARFPNQLLKPKKKPSGSSSSSSSDSITASDTDMMPLKSKSKSKSSSSGSGSSSKWPRPKMLDLSGVLNTDSRGGQYLKKKNAFESFPFIEYGTKKINGIPFKFVDPRIDGVNVLGLRGGYPKSIAFKKTRKVVLPVGRRVDRVHILGLVGGWGFPHSVNGEPVLKVTFLYRGRKTFSESFLLRNGVDIFDFNPFLKKQYPDAPKGGSVAVKGLTSTDVDLRLKTLKTLNKKSVLESVVIESLYSAVAPTIVAVTAEVLPEPPSDRASKKAAQEMTSAMMLATKVAPKDTPEVFKKFHLFWKTSKKVLPVYRTSATATTCTRATARSSACPRSCSWPRAATPTKARASSCAPG